MRLHFLMLVFGLIYFQSYTQIQVLNEADTLAYNIDLDNVVISAQHLPTHYKNSIYNISIISSEQIEKRAVNTLDQVLNQQSNVRINYDPVLGAKISLRGMGSENVAILQDGVPLIGRLDGAIDLTQINLNNIERIEIIEGPQSAFYGNNASGGIINIITKKSQVEPLNIKLTASYDQPSIKNLSANIGIYRSKFFISGGASYLEDRAYANDSLRIFEEINFDDGSTLLRKKYPWNPKLNKSANATTRYFINEENSISARWDYSSQVVNNLGQLRRPVFMPYAFDENYNTKRNNYKLSYNGKINAHKLDVIASRSEFQRILENERFEFDTQSVAEDQTSRDSFNLVNHFLKINTVYQVNKVSLSAGIQLNQDIGKGDRIIDSSRVDPLKVVANEYSLFADIRYKFNSKVTSSFATRLNQHSNYGLQVSPNFQNHIRIDENWNIRFGYARGFRSPDLKELYINFVDVNHFVKGNQDLQPEITNDWNLSFNYDKILGKNNLNTSLKLFSSKILNKIILTEFEPVRFQYRNISNFSIHGTSLLVKYKFENFQLSNDMTYAYRFNISSTTEDIPSHSPVFDNHASLLFEPQNLDFTLELTHRYVGKLPRYFVSNEIIQQSISDSYQLLDLNLSYKLFKNSLQINTGVRNILNVTYANINLNDASGNHTSGSAISSQLVARGRSYYVSLQYNFATK